MQKTISVIITAYNYAQYIEECVESVLNQSVMPDEIFVVDDGSTDNTAELVKKYPEVKYVWQENAGLSAARNTGIGLAKSEYIMCLDADDMLKKDAIKEHMKIAEPDAIAQCGLMYFGTQNAIYRPLGATYESLIKSNTVYCNSVFPKAYWKKVAGFDESETMRLGLEDWEFWIRMTKAGLKVNTSDYIALLYRRHGSTMTHTTTHPNWNKITSYMIKKNKIKAEMKRLD